MEELLQDPRVQVAYADQCQFGLTSKIRAGSDERGPAKKPTGFVTNSWMIAKRLRRTCQHDHVRVKLGGGRAEAAALYPDELCMEMCRGLKDQIEYDATGLKCFGELTQVEMKELIRDMVETAEELVNDNIADETPGSHGDLPPMTHEGRRAADQDQDAVWQSSKPKPISRDRASWADIDDSEHENDTPAWGESRVAQCSVAVTDESLLRGAPRAAQCLAAVADESLPRGGGAQSAAHREMGVVAD